MKRGRLPLMALRSFEAAGRLGSFTLGSEELNVSQAAISRQIRELERSIGKPLFRRAHRTVSLTATGADLLEVLTRSFDDIGGRLTVLASKAVAREVRISAEPSFAACWLVPRLHEFHRLHPDIDVSVESDTRLVTFRRDEPELAIRHAESTRSWPGTQARTLMDVQLVAVASPDLLARTLSTRSPNDVAALPLLHEENRDFWRRWFEAAGVDPNSALRGSVYADSGLLLQGALLGQGAALVDAKFASAAIESGRLLRLFETTIPWGGYCLVARDFAHLADPAKTLAQWIAKAFETDRSNTV